MGDFLVELGSLFLSEGLCHLRNKHKKLYFFVMVCILALFAGVAVLFYQNGSPVKGTFMVLVTLLMAALLVWPLRQNFASGPKAWNSWFDKRL